MTKAYSFVEMLCVIGILLVLASISYPAFLGLRVNSQVSACGSNLHQIQLATALYRAENGGDGTYGDLYSMGLPPFPQIHTIPSISNLKCAGSGIPFPYFVRGSTFPYMSLTVEPESDHKSPSWATYAKAYQDDAVIWVDMNHNPVDVPIMAPEATKFALGVTLGGSLIRKRDRGNPLLPSFWHSDLNSRIR